MRNPERSASSQDWSQTYFDLAPVIFLVLDDGLIVRRINKTGAAVLGMKSEDIVEKSWLEHFVPK